MANIGLFQPPGASGAHGPGPETALRHRNLGCGRKHGGQVARTSGDLPATARPDHLPTSNMHKHEQVASRPGAGGGESDGDTQHTGATGRSSTE